jgi:ABC-type uncharacterized transport system permease subunit
VPGRTLVSAALAASIGAALVSTLALYLNPGLVLRREAEAILICLFLPWTLAGTLLLALLAALASALGARRAFPPLIRRSPFFMSLAFVALVGRRPALLVEPARVPGRAARRGPARAGAVGHRR